MTSVCTGGASAMPGIGVEEFIVLDTVGIAAAVSALGFPEAAPFVAGAIATAAQYSTSTFCVQDPPADPGLVSTDIADLVNFLDPTAQQAAQAKFVQWFDAQYWWKICVCPSGYASSAPTPSNPGAPGSNTGVPDAGVGANCWDHTVTRTPNVTATSSWQMNDSLPAITPGFSASPQDFPRLPTPLPSSVTIKITNTGDGSNNGSVNGFLSFFSSSGGSIAGSGLTTPNCAPGTTQSVNKAVPSNAVFWNTAVTTTAGFTGTPDFDVSFESIIYCAGQSPTGLVSACCPPDTSVDQRLTAIMNLLQQIYSLIPARVPNYAAFTSHIGLSGGGTLSLDSHTIAVKVVFSTLPHVTTEILSTPGTYLDLGWITPETNQGPEGGMRLTRATQVLALPEASSLLNYSFPAGGVASITELQAG